MCLNEKKTINDTFTARVQVYKNHVTKYLAISLFVTFRSHKRQFAQLLYILGILHIYTIRFIKNNNNNNNGLLII